MTTLAILAATIICLFLIMLVAIEEAGLRERNRTLTRSQLLQDRIFKEIKPFKK